ncbi:gamma-butyrobetaine hydroxylase-like domain-containing protein [Aestuariivirga sp.]|uniref:gamma-butyrobetaine hydroxylase-like domain-containing protein n=1 Tax=Aestuariivirga sp. TaxID=2650926 RepID=UPI0035937967
MSDPWPEELRLRSGGTHLAVSFDTGERFQLDAEYLRVESPSAEVKGHGPGQEQLVWGKLKVKIARLEPIGTYAVRIVFDDGHSTGLFTWPYLLKLGRERETIWQAYLDKIAAAGFSRG